MPPGRVKFLFRMESGEPPRRMMGKSPAGRLFYHIGKFVLYDKKFQEDAHANAEEVCRKRDAIDAAPVCRGSAAENSAWRICFFSILINL